MKVFNVMFSKGLGGIEQVFLDYNHALSIHHHQVVPIIHPNASIKNKIYGHFLSVFNFNKFDPFAIYKLRKLIKAEQPKCIITHGNRATSLMKKAAGDIPVIAVCHNYKFKPLLGSDAIIAITKDIKKHLIAAGQPKDSIYHVPNMIMSPEDLPYTTPKFRKPPIIGFVGRFVKKKGVDLLLKSLSILDKKRLDFRAIIAGDGEERELIARLVVEYKLEDKVKLVGWVDDKKAFFDSIDIFCLPSHHEPFGLVLLEAFKHSKAVVATKSEGPSEIAKHEENILFSPVGDAEKLASNLEKIIKDEKLAKKLSGNGYKTVQDYSPWIVGRKLQVVVEEVVFKKLTLK
jgi:glycosyltransferase involved in cell wall biosynthesis